MPHTSSRWRGNLLRISLILGVSLVATAATFKPAVLVVDLDTTPIPASSNATLVCDAPGWALLMSQQQDGPYKLWRTDGTTAGTFQVAQFATTQSASSFTCLYAENQTVFFRYDDDSSRIALWRSDGTTAGTFQLLQEPVGAWELRFIGAVGTTPLFAAFADITTGVELFRSDGTVAGTQLVKEFTPGTDETQIGYSAPVTIGNALLLSVNGSLWMTDASTAGTQVVMDFLPNPNYADLEMVQMGDRLLFTRVNESDQSELWISDGTAGGTSRLIAFDSTDHGPDYIEGLTATGTSRAVFSVYTSSFPQRPVWRTDGTPQGTQRLLASQADLDFVGGPMNPVPGGAVFLASTGAAGMEPWFTDGTDAGTYLVHDHEPGAGSAANIYFTPVKGGLAYLQGNPQKWWFTDGTVNGTWSVSDLNASLAADYATDLPVAIGADFLLWSQEYPPTRPDYRRTLWRVSPSNRSVTRVVDLNAIDMQTSWALRGNKMLFGLDTGSTGMEPWISDGTLAGTKLLRELEPQTQNGSGNPALAFNIGSQVLFSASNGSEESLWTTDGSAAGTQRLSGHVAVASLFGQASMQMAGFTLYPGKTDMGYVELMRTDGTAAGTTVVADLTGNGIGSPYPVSSNPASCGAGFVGDGSVAYYGASPGGFGKLFRTDGTTGGTAAIGTFWPSGGLFISSTQVCVLALSGGNVYFQAVNSPTSETLLWRSNGQVGNYEKVLTASGATLAAPVNMIEMNGSLWFITYSGGSAGLYKLSPGDPVARLVQPRTWTQYNSYPEMVAAVGGSVLFRDAEMAPNGAMTFKMYRSDGSATGVAALGIVGANSPWLPGFGARLGNRYLYPGVADDAGIDLWLTDGTSAGTTPLHIPGTGMRSYTIPEFVNFNGLVYILITRDVAPGVVSEVWRTDGTQGGTEKVNAVPNIFGVGSSPTLMVAGQRLVFSGNTTANGSELWVIENEAPVAQGDNASTTAPNAVTIDVLANDSDPDGVLSRSTLRVATPPAGGTVTVVPGSGTLSYTPNTTFSGTDTFRYVISDMQGRESAAATVSISVAAAPPPPGGGGGGSGGGGGGGSGGGNSGGGGAAGGMSLVGLVLLLAGALRNRARPRTPSSPTPAHPARPCWACP